MASPTATTHTTGVGQILPNYWDSVLGENLYPNLYLYQFGTKRTLPRNFGKTIKIPRLKKQNIMHEVPTEGVAVLTCPLSTQTISTTLREFVGAYKHSDLIIFTALSDVVELSLRDIGRDLAKQMDTFIRNQLSGAGAFVGGNGTTASTCVGSLDFLKPGDIIRAVVKLDTADNPRPPDNHYPTVIHPRTIYDLQTNLSAGSWLDVTKYQEVGAPRIYTGEIGRIYGARFITSSNMDLLLGAAADKLSASGTSISGVREFMFAPDSYYVTEISDLTASTYVKQLGSAGALDPVNQFATVGAKVFFGALPANWAGEVRQVRLIHALSLRA